MERKFFVIGAIFGGLSVAIGAFGAHVLANLLGPEAMERFEIGVRYQMFHALALLTVSWAIAQWRSSARYFRVGGWFFVAGIILFSGSLFALSLSGMRWLGAITPLGGVAFVIGWLTLAYGAWRRDRQLSI